MLNSHRTRTERQIAIGRALLAVFAFAAVSQRVAARGGTLVVDSTFTGSRVEISLPVETRHTVLSAAEGPPDAP